MNEEPSAILVTTDGSAHSRRVLPHAAAFASTRGTSILLLRVIDRDKDIVGESGEPSEAALERTLRAVVADNAATLRVDGIQGEPLATVLGPEESVADAIVRVAHERGVAMLAMHTRGHNAMHHALQGSTALKVLGRTMLPVMLTGAEVAEVPAVQPYRVVVTSDGSPASREVIRALGPLLLPGRFAVTLLRVHEKKSDSVTEHEEMRACEEQLAGLRGLFHAGLELETKVREIAQMGGIDTAIIEEARRLGACAIAASTHGVSGRRHLFAGSTALLLLGRSPLPVIMARAED